MDAATGGPGLTQLAANCAQLGHRDLSKTALRALMLNAAFRVCRDTPDNPEEPPCSSARFQSPR